MPSPVRTEEVVSHAYQAIGSVRETSAILGISKSAVHDIITRSPEAVADAKNKLAGKWAVASESVLEECVAGKHGDFKSKAEAWTAAAIAADKVAKLTEGPQVAVQVNVIGDVLATCDALAEALAASKRQSDIPPVVVEAELCPHNLRENAQSSQVSTDSPVAKPSNNT